MTLCLFPNLLWQGGDPCAVLPPSVGPAVQRIDGLIAESEREGRRFLARFRQDARSVPIALVREKIAFLIEPLIAGESWGLVSDAGLPCIADPGSRLVAAAKKKGIGVEAFTGPCALTLALMLSGMQGQCFSFHGYVAKEPARRKEQLLNWERQVGVQIFIEAPHRNRHTFEACLQLLDPQTELCLAVNLTAPEQQVVTKKIREWRRSGVACVLHKQPTLFLLSRPHEV